jgi:hypothetical protein
MVRLLPFLPVLALLGLLPGSANAEPRHPHLHHVLYDIKQAARELAEAKSEFGGYKGPAIEDLNEAAAQVEKLLKAASDPVAPNYMPDPNAVAGYKDLKHLRHAEDQIERALKELKASNAAGVSEYKEKAIAALEKAWLQVFVCLKNAPK